MLSGVIRHFLVDTTPCSLPIAPARLSRHRMWSPVRLERKGLPTRKSPESRRTTGLGW
jgi:hypothetical protein